MSIFDNPFDFGFALFSTQFRQMNKLSGYNTL